MKTNIIGIVVLFFLFFAGWMGDENIISKTLPDSEDKTKPSIRLKSIYFNHNQVCHPGRSDAIDIVMNSIGDVRVPEWKSGEKSYPAAYIKNKLITIMACFATKFEIPEAEIWAEKTKTSKLKDIEKETVSFKNDGTSDSICFNVSGKTPDEITTFVQKWKWYWKDPKRPNSKPKKIKVSKNNNISENKIYVILSEPKYLWSKSQETKPWADVLDRSCRWANGENEPIDAAEKITQHLYDDIGGRYTSSSPQYSGYKTFQLKKFIEAIPRVHYVNCYDLGKALVIFTDFVGCKAICKESNPFGTLRLSILVGRNWPTGSYFDFHAYASISDKIFDATLVRFKGYRNYMVNFEWEDYIKEILMPGDPDQPKPGNPTPCSFNIDSTKKNEMNPSFSKRLEWAKEKYDYKHWASGSNKIATEIVLSKKILPQLNNMKKIWKKDKNSIEKIEESEYFITNQCWDAGADKLTLTMVVGHTMNEIKKYLIYNYADWSSLPAWIEPVDNIGDICFVIEENHPNSPLHIDFIRYNVLIMMYAEGSIRREIFTISSILDEKLSGK
jgi:hypothetical protein